MKTLDCTARLFFALTGCYLLCSCAQTSVAPSASLVIDNAFILSMEADQRTPYLGYMAIGSDGNILQTAAGKSPSQFSGAKHVDALGKWMLPGFISAHSHLWQSKFSGIAPDANLEGWIDALYGVEAPTLSAADLYALTRRGGMQHAKNGIVTAFNFTFTGKDTSGLVDRCQLRGALDSGIRVVHGFNIRSINPQWSVEQARDRLEKFLQWAQQQPESQRYLGTMIAGSGAYSDTPTQILAEAGLMHLFGLKNQQHYLESPLAAVNERKRYVWMKEAGMIGPNLIFGHFIHPTANILQDASRADVSMTWNPLSNGRLGSGTPDIPRYRLQGLRIGMGIDGEASSDRADPFENMRMGLYQLRAVNQQAAVMSPYDVLWLHTVGSAEVLGLNDQTGSLRPGKHADFLLIDSASFAPYKDPYAALVFAAGVENIDSVYVGGQLIAQQGHILSAEPDKHATCR